jgi:serine/threonine protein kinase
VVVPQQGGGSSSTIKGIDLESAISQNDLLAMYTAEACPPEFPVDDMYQCLPKIRMEYSFDMWGLGMTLFEMATGKPFYADGLTDLEYIKNRLRNPEEMISDLENKLFAVDLEARSVIKQCLMVDPRARSSCQDLLKTPYFTQNNKPSFASIPSSNFGIPSKTATQDQLQTTMQAQYDQEAQRTVLMEQIVELENQLKLSDVSNHQLQEELSATKSEIKAWKEHKDEVNNLRANIKEASEERAVMMESIRNKTEQRLSEATQSLSDVQSQLASAKEEVASLLSDNKSLLSQISAMTASREAILSNLKEMEVIVDATKNSASIATFAEAKVVNQVGISRLQETQNEVTAHLQHHDMLQHIQNEKLPHRTELQDPNPHTLQPLRFEDRLASVLDVINACALHDPDVAKDLLSILEQSQNGLSPRMTL